jgi:hypothetical protein
MKINRRSLFGMVAAAFVGRKAKAALPMFGAPQLHPIKFYDPPVMSLGTTEFINHYLRGARDMTGVSAAMFGQEPRR